MNRPAGRTPPYRIEIRGRKYAICRWTLTFGSSFFGSGAASVIRDATSWISDEMIASPLMPKPRMYRPVVYGSGRPHGNWPEVTGFRQALMTWLAASNCGAAGHSMLGNRLIQNTCHIALGL